jgi:ABC-type multidrug transport system ATPase subunit
VALLGPNGSGKTTLTRALMGLVAADGEILIDGTPLTDRLQMAARLAYVPQIAPQMAATVDEVVAAIGELRGVAERGGRRSPATSASTSIRWAAAPLRALSGGMRQKLLLALALASPPRAADPRRADRQPRRRSPGPVLRSLRDGSAPTPR